MFYWWTAWPTGTVHLLQVDCLAYWHAACSAGGLLGLLSWYMFYRWTAWPTYIYIVVINESYGIEFDFEILKSLKFKWKNHVAQQVHTYTVQYTTVQ